MITWVTAPTDDAAQYTYHHSIPLRCHPAVCSRWTPYFQSHWVGLLMYKDCTPLSSYQS